jgi:hypothetical protein
MRAIHPIVPKTLAKITSLHGMVGMSIVLKGTDQRIIPAGMRVKAASGKQHRIERCARTSGRFWVQGSQTWRQQSAQLLARMDL